MCSLASLARSFRCVRLYANSAISHAQAYQSLRSFASLASCLNPVYVVRTSFAFGFHLPVIFSILKGWQLCRARINFDYKGVPAKLLTQTRLPGKLLAFTRATLFVPYFRRAGLSPASGGLTTRRRCQSPPDSQPVCFPAWLVYWGRCVGMVSGRARRTGGAAASQNKRPEVRSLF